MGNELTTGHQVLATPSLPPRVAALAKWVGTVEHPGQPTRYHLPTGVELPEEVREEARNHLSTLNSALNPMAPFADKTAEEAKLGIVTTLIMGLAMGSTSEAAADARFDLYEIALDDVPAWAVAKAVRRWVKRDCPPSIDKSPNFAFPPGPAVLRALAGLELEPYRAARDHAERLVAATTLDRAMDPTPLPAPAAKAISGSSVPKLRKM